MWSKGKKVKKWNKLEIDKIRVNCEIKEPNMDILYYYYTQNDY